MCGLGTGAVKMINALGWAVDSLKNIWRFCQVTGSSVLLPVKKMKSLNTIVRQFLSTLVLSIAYFLQNDLPLLPKYLSISLSTQLSYFPPSPPRAEYLSSRLPDNPLPLPFTSSAPNSGPRGHRTIYELTNIYWSVVFRFSYFSFSLLPRRTWLPLFRLFSSLFQFSLIPPENRVLHHVFVLSYIRPESWPHFFSVH